MKNQSYDVVICSHVIYGHTGGVEVYNKRLIELFLKNNLKVLYFVTPTIQQENKQKNLCDITYDLNFAFLMAKKAKFFIYSGWFKNNHQFLKIFSELKNSVIIQHENSLFFKNKDEK
jgi:hypothetical protein